MNTTIVAITWIGGCIMILYHGSEKIIDAPEFGKGNSHNDYGRGFYCTENEELAKEWACSNNNNGFANKYEFDIIQSLFKQASGTTFNIFFHPINRDYHTYFRHNYQHFKIASYTL